MENINSQVWFIFNYTNGTNAQQRKPVLLKVIQLRQKKYKYSRLKGCIKKTFTIPHANNKAWPKQHLLESVPRRTSAT